MSRTITHRGFTIEPSYLSPTGSGRTCKTQQAWIARTPFAADRVRNRIWGRSIKEVIEDIDRLCDHESTKPAIRAAMLRVAGEPEKALEIERAEEARQQVLNAAQAERAAEYERQQTLAKAAPDLLAALREITDAFPAEGWPEPHRSMLLRGRAAITKATGAAS